MEDFSVFNEVYSEFFGDSGAPARSLHSGWQITQRSLS
ncbi:RidA family protein [Klebsiella pneumoniae]|nr:RidA family protein [Klebsiella pneumoniae]